jgi:hypothetical protein
MHKFTWAFATALGLHLLLLSYSLSAHGQETAPAAAAAPTPVVARPASTGPKRLDADLVAFFAGDWTGAGEFASGKKIEADVNFHADLDQQWLVYTHRDRLPNRFKAIGMWGYEATSKQLIMTVNDSFGGARMFSSIGWADGKVIFANNMVVAPAATPPGRQERFTFERQGPRQFRMTYETSTDGNVWRLGDWVVFLKRA